MVETRSFEVEGDSTHHVAIRHHETDNVAESNARRILDVAGSVLGLLIFSPVLITIAIAIKSDDKGPVIYRALRADKNGRPFYLYKFRTMVVGADRQGPGI